MKEIPLDSINFTFKLKKVYFFKSIRSCSKKYQGFSNGKYYIYDDNLNLKNNIFKNKKI